MADNLFNAVYNPDVLSCLANLSNDEVFTPPDVVNQMLDMLPQELFRNPDVTFLEIIVPYMIQLRFGDFVKECKNLLIYRLSDTEGCAEVLFFCLPTAESPLIRRRGVCRLYGLPTHITKSLVP